MQDIHEQDRELRALAMRVSALEDNVAFIERWCEEQQDALDRAIGSVSYAYEVDREPEVPPPTLLRVVDLRDDLGDDIEDGEIGTIVALVDPEHDRALRVLRAQLNRLRTRLAASLAPAELPEVSAKPAGRTAP
jgi:hypothetical protein